MTKKGESIFKRKDGRWEGRYIKDRDSKNKAIYGYIYGNCYEEVKHKKDYILGKNDNLKTQMIYSTLLDMWLKNQKKYVKESTYIIYYLHIRNHIKPVLGKYDISAITNNHIQRFIDDKLSMGRLNSNGGLSSKTVKELTNVIKLSLRYAIKNELIENINFDLRITSNKKKCVLLNTSECKLLSNYLKIDATSLHIGILLMMSTGIRIGELCALQNKDINIFERIITIDKTVQRITDVENKKTKILLQSSKTSNSIRKIPLPESIIQYLTITGNPNYYFLTQKEKCMEPRTFRYAFKRIIKKLQLPEVTVHSLRHQFATQCIELGFDYNCLSEILGHASPSTTMNLYVHSKFDYKRECMNKIIV